MVLVRTHAQSTHTLAGIAQVARHRNGILCAILLAGLLAIILQPNGSFKTHDWSRQTRLVGGKAGLAAWQQWCVGGPLLVGWRRDPWGRLGPVSNDQISMRDRDRPEALSLEIECVAVGACGCCQAQLSSGGVLQEVQACRGGALREALAMRGAAVRGLLCYARSKPVGWLHFAGSITGQAVNGVGLALTSVQDSQTVRASGRQSPSVLRLSTAATLGPSFSPWKSTWLPPLDAWHQPPSPAFGHHATSQFAAGDPPFSH